MKKLLTLIFCAICAIGYGQFAPTGTKTNFKNGIALGSKDSTAFNTNDSLAVTIDRNGRFMYRGLGAAAYWKVPQVGTDTVPDTRFVRLQQPTQFRQDGGFWISDTGRTSRLFRAQKFYGDTLQATGSGGGVISTNGGTTVASWGAGGSTEFTAHGFAGYNANRGSSYTERSWTDKGYVDSADDLRVKYTDTASMLSPYVRGASVVDTNAIALYNGTTGKLIKNSPLRLDNYPNDSYFVLNVAAAENPSYGTAYGFDIKAQNGTGTNWGGNTYLIAGSSLNGRGGNVGLQAGITGSGSALDGGNVILNVGQAQGGGQLGTVNITGVSTGSAALLDIRRLTLTGGAKRFYFPDSTGTLALTSNLSAYLPLTGGTVSSIASSGIISATSSIISQLSSGGTMFIPQISTSELNDSSQVVLSRSGSGTYNLASIDTRQETANASTGSLSINTYDAGGKQRGIMFDKSQTATLYRALTTTDNLTVSRNQNATTEILASNTDNTNSTSRGRVRIVGGTVESFMTSIATLGTYIGSSSNHPLQLITNGSDRVTISTSGNVRFNNYGAGTLTTDASGNITASSDTTMKHLIAPLDTVLGKIMDFKPYYFKWRASTGLDTANQYLSITAQSIGKSFPLALGKSSDGTLTVQDRAVLAIAVKAIQELKSENDTLKAELAELKAILKQKGIL